MRSIAAPRVLTDAGFLFSGSGSIFFIFLLVLCSHRVRVLFPLGNRRGGGVLALAPPEVLVFSDGGVDWCGVCVDLVWGGGGCDGSELDVVVAPTVLRWVWVSVLRR
jgi:hypothetical protein